VAHPWRSRKFRRGKLFFLNLWKHLETLDLIRSETFLHWERKAGRIQYEFRTKLSSNKGIYLPFYSINSSGYNRGPFNKEFHRKQVIKELLTHKIQLTESSDPTHSKGPPSTR
jgi:hypothetical protein